MKTWLINCKVSMTYEIEAETENEAQDIAADIFAVDVIDLEIDVETK